MSSINRAALCSALRDSSWAQHMKQIEFVCMLKSHGEICVMMDIRRDGSEHSGNLSEMPEKAGLKPQSYASTLARWLAYKITYGLPSSFGREAEQ